MIPMFEYSWLLINPVDLDRFEALPEDRLAAEIIACRRGRKGIGDGVAGHLVARRNNANAAGQQRDGCPVLHAVIRQVGVEVEPGILA
jgi:hypothetical protein